MSANRTLYASTLCFALGLMSCTQQKVPLPDPGKQFLQEMHDAKAGRFQPFGPTNKVALDTKTGLACKTWDWDDTNSEADFPMCVNLLYEEDRTLMHIRSSVDFSDQLKEAGENPYRVPGLRAAPAKSQKLKSQQ